MMLGARRSVLLCVLGAAIFAVLVVYGVARVSRIRTVARVERYASIRLVEEDVVVQEEDKLSQSFIDGRYTVVIRMSRSHIDRLIREPPAWATSEWSACSTSQGAWRDECLGQCLRLSAYGGSPIGMRTLTVEIETGTVRFELVALK